MLNYTINDKQMHMELVSWHLLWSITYSDLQQTKSNAEVKSQFCVAWIN